MGCAYTGSGGGPMRTEMPTETCPNDAAENDNTRMLNNTQRTMDRFIRWTFLDFVPRPKRGFACNASLCRKTPESPWLRSSCINPGLPRMLRSKDAENEEVRSAQGRLLAALGLNLMREGRRQRRARRQVKHEFRFTPHPPRIEPTRDHLQSYLPPLSRESTACSTFPNP